jgi:hypothetical protein
VAEMQEVEAENVGGEGGNAGIIHMAREEECG